MITSIHPVISTKNVISRNYETHSKINIAIKHYKTINILFNNAGINPMEGRTHLADCPEETWDMIMDVNVKGIYRCCKAIIPHMIQNKGGSIINMSSTFGLVGFEDRAAYTASKGAVTQLTKSMAVDYGQYNIRVNCVCPGMVINERVKLLIAKAEEQGTLQKILKDYPLQRLGHPEDVARLASFLGSDEACWITGAIIAVDGGFTAK